MGAATPARAAPSRQWPDGLGQGGRSKFLPFLRLPCAATAARGGSRDGVVSRPWPATRYEEPVLQRALVM